MKINSSENPKIKLIKKYINQRNYRKKADFFILENLNAIRDIATNAPHLIQFICYIDSIQIDKIFTQPNNFPLYQIDEKLLNDLTDSQSPQGIIAVVNKQQPTFKELLPNIKNAVLLDSVSNPSNLGAIIRNAVAYNLDAIFYTENTVYPYHPVAIRAMAGNVFQKPFLEVSADEISSLIRENFSLFCLDPHQGVKLGEAKFGDKNLFVFGSEGHGVSSELIKETALPLQIEMPGNTESLNVAVSSGILFYMFRYIIK